MNKNKVLYGITILAALRVLTFDMVHWNALQLIGCMASVFWLFCFGIANRNRRYASGDS